MILNLDTWINVVFLITTLITILIFYFANNRPLQLILLIIGWSIFQSILAYVGFYQNSVSIPPRFLLVLLPPTLLIVFGLLKKQREWIYKNKKTEISTFLHTIRIPVEIILLYLFFHKMIPELMTFEGLNFDIAAGITAPIIGILYYTHAISKKALLIWNILGLILILSILTMGVLSAELPIQQFAFDQPNRALNYFPFILLAATVVPIVIYTHISDILKLLKEIKSNN